MGNLANLQILRYGSEADKNLVVEGSSVVLATLFLIVPACRHNKHCCNPRNRGRAPCGKGEVSSLDLSQPDKRALALEQ